MNSLIHRRAFLRTSSEIGLALSGIGGLSLLAAEPNVDAPNAKRLGWRMGCETWTFHLFTLFEAVDKTASLGLRYIETGGMNLSKAHPDVIFDENASAEVRRATKEKLGGVGIQLIGYWPNAFFKEVGQNRRIFDFAKDMDIETLVGEPEEDAFNALERLCDEYNINVAIHNHPKPAPYWNPDTSLKVCRGRGKRIGVCADTGHWLRSGLNPVECLRKLEGRILSLHFKDLDRAGPDAHDVPWGTGACNVKGMLAELHRQGVRSPFFIEYEDKWENNLPEIVRSLAYFDNVAGELAGRK
jgi:sugar phosphate isomerase/epimerase